MFGVWGIEGRQVMSRKMVEQTLVDIEENQAALRQSIEESKQLAAQSDELIETHRRQVRQQAEA